MFEKFKKNKKMGFGLDEEWIKSLEANGDGELIDDEMFHLHAFLVDKAIDEEPFDIVALCMGVGCSVSAYCEIEPHDFDRVMDIFKEFYAKHNTPEKIALRKSMLKYDLV